MKENSYEALRGVLDSGVLFPMTLRLFVLTWRISMVKPTGPIVCTATLSTLTSFQHQTRADGS